MLPTTYHRRSFLQLGTAGYLGLSLGSLWKAQLAAAAQQTLLTAPSIKACILVFYYGGPSHLDTWDMKPNAPIEIRGSFQSISTSVPGLRICEHLPHMSKWMHKVGIIRSVHHQHFA